MKHNTPENRLDFKNKKAHAQQIVRGHKAESERNIFKNDMNNERKLAACTI